MPAKKKVPSADFSDSDLMYLQEGLVKGAEQQERDRAKAVIEGKTDFILLTKSEYRHLQKRAEKRVRPPGRKPASSRNATDQDEADRIAEIRHLLGKVARKLPKPAVLDVVLALVENFNSLRENFNSLRENGVFLSRHEQAVVHVLSLDESTSVPNCMKDIEEGHVAIGREWPGDLPSTDEIVGWLRAVDRVEKHNDNSMHWPSLFKDALAKVEKMPSSGVTDDAKRYRAMKAALGLLPAGEMSVLSDSFAPDVVERGLDQDAPNSSELSLYPTVTVPQTLRAVAKQLTILRYVADNCKYFPMSLPLENLYLFVRSIGRANLDGMPPSFVEKMEGVFFAIHRRQGRTPFPNLADEELQLGGATIPLDGQTDWI